LPLGTNDISEIYSNQLRNTDTGTDTVIIEQQGYLKELTFKAIKACIKDDAAEIENVKRDIKKEIQKYEQKYNASVAVVEA
jgi:hypothetical protein